MLVFLDDGKALAIGPEEGENGVTKREKKREGGCHFLCGCALLAADWLLDSLAGVVGGVLGAVTRAVAAEKAGGVLWRHRRVLAWAAGLRFYPGALQDVVRVLTCSWIDGIREPQSESSSGYSTSGGGTAVTLPRSSCKYIWSVWSHD